MQDRDIVNKLLDKVSSIVDLPESEIRLLTSKVKQIDLDANMHLIKEGQVANGIYFVSSGLFRTYLNCDGVETNTEFFFENSFMSAFTSFLTQQKTSLNIVAIEKSAVLEIPKAHLEELYGHNPKWYALGKKIFEEEFIKKCRRESSFLNSSAKERYIDVVSQYPQIETRVPLFQIASYLGIQPETLSRIRSSKLTYIKQP